MTAPPKLGPPRIKLGELVLDLGKGETGQELKGAIDLKNVGEQVLTIDRIDPGCGCSSYELPQDRIQPGATAPLKITVRMRPRPRPLEFVVRVSNNDPDNPEVSFRVRAEGPRSILSADPEEINFGSTGMALHKRLKLLKADGTPWPRSSPLTFSSSKGLVDIAWSEPEVRSPDAPAVLTVTPRSELPAGIWNDTITLAVPGNQHDVLISVEGFVSAGLLVAPARVQFREVSEPGNQRRFVQVRRGDAKPVGRMARFESPQGITAAEEDSSKEVQSSKRIMLALDPSLVKRPLQDAKVEIWFENEPKPATITVGVK